MKRKKKEESEPEEVYLYKKDFKPDIKVPVPRYYWKAVFHHNGIKWNQIIAAVGTNDPGVKLVESTDNQALT